MPSLLYILDGVETGGAFGTRVLIGRRMSRGAVLTDPTVSRLHAWIDPRPDGGWVVTDAGSKAGTRVNGQPIARRTLADGDVIAAGNVSLTFHDYDFLPADVREVVLDSATADVKTSGVLFDCRCGAPLWVGIELAGKRGLCKHCKQMVTVPSAKPVDRGTATRSSAISPPVSAGEPGVPTGEPGVPAGEPGVSAGGGPNNSVSPGEVAEPSIKPRSTRNCGVCHAPLADGEAAVICPDCAVGYHAECWEENRGCSSYGCPRVGVLDPSTVPAEPVVGDDVTADAPFETPAESRTQSPVPAAVPWGRVLLAAAVASAVLGSVLGGLPSLLVGTWIMTAGRKKTVPTAGLVASMLICCVGVVGGLYVSDLLWLNGRYGSFIYIR